MTLDTLRKPRTASGEERRTNDWLDDETNYVSLAPVSRASNTPPRARVAGDAHKSTE